MLYYDRTDVSGGIDVNKTTVSRECCSCHYWHFINYSSNFQSNVCNRCHDLLMMSTNLSDIALLNIKRSDYLTVCSCHVTYAFESESTLYSCLNVKELLARNRRDI